MIVAAYTERAPTVHTDAQDEQLRQVAETRGKPVSVPVRKALESVYIAPQVAADRLAALEELLALNAPVADWEESVRKGKGQLRTKWPQACCDWRQTSCRLPSMAPSRRKHWRASMARPANTRVRSDPCAVIATTG